MVTPFRGVAWYGATLTGCAILRGRFGRSRLGSEIQGVGSMLMNIAPILFGW